MKELLHQLRLVVFSHLCTGFYTSQVVVWDFFHHSCGMQKFAHLATPSRVSKRRSRWLPWDRFYQRSGIQNTRRFPSSRSCREFFEGGGMDGVGKLWWRNGSLFERDLFGDFPSLACAPFDAMLRCVELIVRFHWDRVSPSPPQYTVILEK